MRHLPHDSYLTTLQRKNSRAKTNGKVYAQYYVYLPTPEVELLGWSGGVEVRLVKGKNRQGKFVGWLLERHLWRCVKCGKESPGESVKCVSCGTVREQLKSKRKRRDSPGKRLCVQCHKRNPADALYCINCGSSIPPRLKLAEPPMLVKT